MLKTAVNIILVRFKISNLYRLKIKYKLLNGTKIVKTLYSFRKKSTLKN